MREKLCRILLISFLYQFKIDAPRGYKEMSSILAEPERPSIWAQMRGGGRLRGLSQWVHRSPIKHWRSNSIFNLWMHPTIQYRASTTGYPTRSFLSIVWGPTESTHNNTKKSQGEIDKKRGGGERGRGSPQKGWNGHILTADSIMWGSHYPLYTQQQGRECGVPYYQQPTHWPGSKHCPPTPRRFLNHPLDSCLSSSKLLGH